MVILIHHSSFIIRHSSFSIFHFSLFHFSLPLPLHFSPSTPVISDLTLHMKHADIAGPEQTEIRSTFFPAEWFPQSGVQLTWPHAATDWADLLPEVDDCFIHIALEILVRNERLLIVTPEPDRVKALFHERIPSRLLPQVTYFQCPTNDTWARDHAFLTLMTEAGPRLLDFRFNGWGNKFPSDLDNAINQRLASQGPSPWPLSNSPRGGEGRPADDNTANDARGHEILPPAGSLPPTGGVGEGPGLYQLIPLPMPSPIYDPDDGHRLPATYANFLVINGAVLMPTYGQPANDELARAQLQKAFPRYDIVPIDCRVLIRQHGSLHCSTMQYPLGVLC